MQYRKFVLSVADEGLQENELNRFLRGHRVVKVESTFLESDKMWVFLVSYLDGEQRDTSSPVHRSELTKFNPEKELNDEQLARYKKYAEIRLDLARKYGVKAFVVFTNRELGELSKFETLSETELRKVEGIGDARIEQYGHEFINLLNNYETSGTPDGAGGADGQPL